MGEQGDGGRGLWFQRWDLFFLQKDQIYSELTHSDTRNVSIRQTSWYNPINRAPLIFFHFS